MNPNDVALEIGKRFFLVTVTFMGSQEGLTIIVEPIWGPWNLRKPLKYGKL